MSAAITALEVQRKNQKRVNVYLDGKYAFALQALVAARLRVGQTLTLEETEQLREFDSAEVAYDRVLNFLSYRPRSRAEIEAYLERRKVRGSVAQTILDRLAQAGLLDDEAFARYWVENRELFRPRGARALRSELRRKRIADTIVDEAIGGIDQAESAYRAALERAQRLGNLDYVAFHRRLAGFLQRRGFDYDIVKETVSRLWKELQAPTEEKE